LYEELKERNFVLMAVALDSRGDAAVRQYIEPAKPTYPCLIDREHRVAELYGMLNVPSAVWINEAGRIVRPSESAGYDESFRKMDPETRQIPPEVRERSTRKRQLYYEAVRDWVERGDKSPYVLPEPRVRERLRPPTPERSLAFANFRLGVYLWQQGRAAEAQPFFAEAGRLWPENWNPQRQGWNLDESGQSPVRNIRGLLASLGDHYFYEPIDMPGME
jgi:hypothetical protein